MSKEELLQFLRDNLSVSINVKRSSYYGSSNDQAITVQLKLGKDVISEDYETISIPTVD